MAQLALVLLLACHYLSALVAPCELKPNRQYRKTRLSEGVLAEVTERSVVAPQTAEREGRDSHRTMLL